MKATKLLIGLVLIPILFGLMTHTFSYGIVNAVSQSDLYSYVNQTAANFTGELVDFRISNNGSVDIINDSEILIYTYLVMELDTGGSELREVESEITVRLKRIGPDWNIDNWELGHRDRDEDDRSSENQNRQEVDRLLNDIFTAILFDHTSDLYDYLDSDFEYEGPALDGERREVDLNRREFISVLDEIFAEGRYFSTLRLEDRNYDIDDDEVEIEGTLIMVGKNPDGSRFINLRYYAEFELEKRNGVWYLEEWEED